VDALNNETCTTRRTPYESAVENLSIDEAKALFLSVSGGLALK